MNDRFKFRAWDEKNKKMEYDISLTNDGRAVKKGYQWFLSGNTVLNSPVMQCTGLKDKNGKLIYEGDILREYNDTISLNKSYNNIYYVEWEAGTCCFLIFYINEDMKKDIFDLSLANRFEIIGNIYENPELLEK
jgi:uncharacterized phage protein (TIGR01671 family)